MLASVLTPGTRFEAAAHLFGEFSLSSGNDEILRFRYVFDAEVEKQGGIAFHAEYSPGIWKLEFYRTPYLQRESYRVLCNGEVVLKTDVLRLLQSDKISYQDGSIWSCRIGLLGKIEVENPEGEQILHASQGIGVVQGVSDLCIDREVSLERALPLLIALMHATTHESH